MNRIAFQFDPYSPEVDADPFPLYARLREDFPCLWSEQAGMWVLSRYDDIAHALQDWQTYSSSQGNLMDELPGRAGFTLGSTDPPRHDRLRALVQAAFTPKSVEQLKAPTVALATELADRVAGKDRFEFIGDFSSRITVAMLFALMGLPEEDHREVRSNVMLSIQSDAGTRQKTDAHIAAFQRLVAYVEGQVAERRAKPRDDLISRTVQAEIDGDRLKESEIVMTTTTLIIAGVESLSSFMSMFALNLATFPEARQRMVADPSLVDRAMEESLRYNTSAQRFRRVLMRDVELHGSHMKAGDFVCLAYGSGNRDGSKFPDPDRFDIDRRPRGHLGFGGGKHLCLGTAIARMVTINATRVLLARVPDFRVAAERLDWTPSTTFRSPVALPLAIGA